MQVSEHMKQTLVFLLIAVMAFIGGTTTLNAINTKLNSIMENQMRKVEAPEVLPKESTQAASAPNKSCGQ